MATEVSFGSSNSRAARGKGSFKPPEGIEQGARGKGSYSSAREWLRSLSPEQIVELRKAGQLDDLLGV